MAVCDPLWPAVPRRALSVDPATAAASSGGDLTLLLGHSFAHGELLAEALTHPSAIGLPYEDSRRIRRRRTTQGARRNYERLEFLGDRVLGLIIAELLWHRFTKEAEGPLTRRLAQLVRRETLAAIAAEIGLGPYIRTSPAEAAAGGAQKPGILADVLEAVVAAIYLDGGFVAARSFVERWWGPRIGMGEPPPRDPKTVLQEWAQARGLPLPVYQLVATDGPDHALRFTVAVGVAGNDQASATASSKRAAETAAAAALLERLMSDGQSSAAG